MTEKTPSVRTYLLVYLALLLLLAATVAAAYIRLGAFNLVIALGIAGLKALLIIFFFMHVKGSSKLVKLFAFAGFLWLLIFFLLTLSDYVARVWAPTLSQYQ